MVSVEMEIPCKECGLVFIGRASDVKRGHAKFCSRTCSATYNAWKKSNLSKTAFLICAWCKVSFSRKGGNKTSKSGLVFCCREHKDVAQRVESGIKAIQPPHYGTSPHLHDYRHYAMTNMPNACNRCGYDKYVGILEVHHINRDRSNNSLSNLEILCPNCHQEEHYLANDGRY